MKLRLKGKEDHMRSFNIQLIKLQRKKRETAERTHQRKNGREFSQTEDRHGTKVSQSSLSTQQTKFKKHTHIHTKYTRVK